MKNGDLKDLLPQLTHSVKRLRPYVGLIFFVLVSCVYGYVILQINSLSDPLIDDSAVSAEVKSTGMPRIDAEAVKQLETLKDNSVNVQALFDQNRTNPFQE